MARVKSAIIDGEVSLNAPGQIFWYNVVCTNTEKSF